MHQLLSLVFGKAVQVVQLDLGLRSGRGYMLGRRRLFQVDEALDVGGLVCSHFGRLRIMSGHKTAHKQKLVLSSYAGRQKPSAGWVVFIHTKKKTPHSGIASLCNPILLGHSELHGSRSCIRYDWRLSLHPFTMYGTQSWNEKKKKLTSARLRLLLWLRARLPRKALTPSCQAPQTAETSERLT